MRDYDWVVKVISNPANTEKDIKPIQKLVENFRRKWSGYKFNKYVLDLHAKWSKLDQDLFDKKIEKYGK